MAQWINVISPDERAIGSAEIDRRLVPRHKLIRGRQTGRLP